MEYLGLLFQAAWFLAGAVLALAVIIAAAVMVRKL